jgi:hypothetical protein
MSAVAKGDLPDKLLDPGAQLERFLVVDGGAGPFSGHTQKLKVLGSVSVCLLFKIDQFRNQFFLAHFQLPFQQCNTENGAKNPSPGLWVSVHPEGFRMDTGLQSGTKSGPWALDPAFCRFVLLVCINLDALLYGSAYFQKT